ncbi:hypothetical protein ES708_31147 [subsurface metagenome]
MENIVDKSMQIKNVHLGNMMLKQLTRGEITLEEYIMKCAYWGMKTLDDLYYKSLPSKPLSVFEYEQLPYSKRKKLTQEYFTDHPGILKYYEEKNRVIRENQESLLRLKRLKKDIPEGDLKSHEKIDTAIMDFKRKMAGSKF